jgi:hypothetical protein
MAGLSSKKPLVGNPPRFVALPTEIRLQIYRLLFEGAEINVTAEADHKRPYTGRTVVALPNFGVLMSCRLCYDEGLDTLWSCAIWVFRESKLSGQLPPFPPFIDKVSHQGRLHLVKHIEVRILRGPSKQDLAQLVNLRSLIIDLGYLPIEPGQMHEQGRVQAVQVTTKSGIIALVPPSSPSC